MSTATVRTLRMKFETEMGKEAAVSVNHCRDDVTAAEVRDAMDVMIANPVFVHGLVSGEGAEIVERTVTKLF